MKKELGQYYTTNVDYIFDGFSKDIHNIVEPFAGNFDLMNWCNKNGECYDIEPRNNLTVKQNTLLNPPCYKQKFVLTNPPYLAKNKNKDKIIYDLYKTDDLYKAFIKSIIDADGGYIIIPQNFFYSEDSDIRNIFFSFFRILRVNIFEESVFDDTTYSVCAIHFEKGIQDQPIPFYFYPDKEVREIVLSKDNGWKVGGDIDLLKKNNSSWKVSRLIKGQTPNTTLFLRCVDTGTIGGEISLEYGREPYYGKKSDRVFATVLCNKNIPDEKLLSDQFNKRFNDLRKKYRSMFLTNYRNSLKYQRKRLSFYDAYNIIENLLDELFT